MKIMFTISRKIFLITLLMLALFSCRDPYNHELDLAKLNFAESDTPEPTELDNWLFDTFTDPYNIEVKYHFDGSELNVTRTLVPPQLDKVELIMNVVNDVWIQPYIEVAGEAFFKKFTPKQFVLVGSGSYNPGGTVTLGTAEGGRKVILFSLNTFKSDDRSDIKDQMHIVHHEFAHILHQNILFPDAFKEITRGEYTAEWHLVSTTEAHLKGFITSYSMASEKEDFVEILATMVTEGKRGYDRIVCSIPSDEAQALLRQKEEIVVRYFKETYNIDVYELQEKVDQAMENFAPKKLIADLGNRLSQVFNRITIDSAQTPAYPTGFQTIYDDIHNNIDQLPGNNGYYIDEISLFFSGGNTMEVVFYILDADEEFYFALYEYSFSENSSGIIDFTLTDKAFANLEFETALEPLADYFADYTFIIDWVPADSEGCVFDFGGFFPQEISNTWFLGTIGN